MLKYILFNMKNRWLVIAGIVFVSLSAGAKDNNDRLDNSAVTSGPKAVMPPTGPQEAKVIGNQIVLSDDRTFELTVASSQYIVPQVIMKNPVGANVTIAYPDGQNTFTAQVPFIYNVPVSSKYNAYFKLTVVENIAGKTWYIKLQNNSYTDITIK